MTPPLERHSNGTANGGGAGNGKQTARQQEAAPQRKANMRRQVPKLELSPPDKQVGGSIDVSPTVMQKVVRKVKRKSLTVGKRFGRSFGSRANRASEQLQDVADCAKSEAFRNSVGTLDLFKFASCRETCAICAGVCFMVYAASWQPISVFILATMASLMGQYSKQIDWLHKLNATASADEQIGGLFSQYSQGNSSAKGAASETTTTSTTTTTTASSLATVDSVAEQMIEKSQLLVGAAPQTAATGLWQPQAAQQQSTYEEYSFLGWFHSLVTPLFDFGATQEASGGASEAHEQSIFEAMRKMLEHENNQFLRKSFQINGSAFLLALTQLAAFALGLTLITWAAKRQAARIKILYFDSCLHQEVTWFEAVDSAGGAGSSLNNLVEKYEDGIGPKLALMCYFLGHVTLFAISALYQMFSLASFCMPFVLFVGLVIARLSNYQANAIGAHAILAKRSLQLAEEIIAAIRTVFAFNGQQKELERYSNLLEPVYKKSLIKHLYTALNTSISKFSIFACFAAYCFYAKRLFPPYSTHANSANKATILAVMRGAEVSIVNILISIPFIEALQQSKGSIARIYLAIERKSQIDAASTAGLRPRAPPSRATALALVASAAAGCGAASNGATATKWQPSISFRMVEFGYADRVGLAERLSLELKGKSAPPPPPPPPPLPLPAAQNEAAPAAAGEQARDATTLAAPSLKRSPSALSVVSAVSAVSATSSRRKSAAIRQMLGSEVAARTKDSRVLKHFNLHIKPGQSVALVGPSGSGKSTVLSLIQRLYDVSGGQLLVGECNVRDLNVAWLRNQIGVVGQEPRLFDMSIAENILLGLPTNQTNFEGDDLFLDEDGAQMDLIDLMLDEDCDGGGESTAAPPNRRRASSDASQKRNAQKANLMQQVVEAARAAGAHEFIVRLPCGYATKVGSGGVQLSGGQKQRIAIARALIRRPKILLLDECTSALDTDSEARVQTALRAPNLGGGERTTVIVAHRLETIKQVDMIVVMSDGQVVECGTHDELMAKGGGGGDCADAGGVALYRQMYEEQLRSAVAAASRKRDVDVEVGKPEANEAQVSGDTLGRIICAGNDDDDDSDDYTCDEDDLEGLDDEASGEDEDEAGGRNAGGDRPTALELWRFVEMPKWSALAAALVCLLGGLILPLNLIAHSYLFSVFAYQELEQIGAYLHVFGLLILSSSTIVFVISFLEVLLPGYVGEKMSSRLRSKTMDALLEKPVFYFDMSSNSAGALCDRFNTYVGNLQSIAGTRSAILLEAVTTLAAGAIFGLGQNLALSLFCLSFALLVLVTTIVESRLVERESSWQQKCDAQLAHMMTDALSNIKTIASLNKERYFTRKFESILERRRLGASGRANWLWLRTFLTSLKFVMPALSWSASMYYGSRLLACGRIDLQTIYIVCPVVLFAVNDTFRALVFLPELVRAKQAIVRLYKLNNDFSPKVLETLSLGEQLERQNELHLAQVELQPQFNAAGRDDAARPAPNALRAKKSIVSFAPDSGGGGERRDAAASDAAVNRRLSTVNALPSYLRRKSSRLNSLVPKSAPRGKIRFDQVEFAYPNRPQALVLDGFSLQVAPGESVALVGASGSGKSTTVAILEKFYDFHGGQVAIDNRDLRLVDPTWIRQQIGLVQQEPCLLSYTIGDNIRYGDNSRFVTMSEVVAAAKTANIHDFIMSLPDKYDTQLSGSSHSSCQLSGGQRQRIAIARALVRNAPILIFDEATSALDNRSEQIVQDALEKARKGRTSLTIAHRLATIKNSDKIVVVRDGKVVEEGKHEQLLAKPNGHYKRLWARQAASGGGAGGVAG